VPVEGAAQNATGKGADDWLSSTAAPAEAPKEFDWVRPFDEAVIPLDEWVDSGLTWTVDHFRPAFQAVRVPIDATLTGIEQGLLAVPPLLMIALLGLIAWQVSGRRLAIG
jgi:glycine betaine/proline transport system permease protein